MESASVFARQAVLNGLYLVPLLDGVKHHRRKRRRWLPSAKAYKTREFTALALPAQRTETRGRSGRKESRDESNATY